MSCAMRPAVSLTNKIRKLSLPDKRAKQKQASGVVAGCWLLVARSQGRWTGLADAGRALKVVEGRGLTRSRGEKRAPRQHWQRRKRQRDWPAWAMGLPLDADPDTWNLQKGGFHRRLRLRLGLDIVIHGH